MGKDAIGYRTLGPALPRICHQMWLSVKTRSSMAVLAQDGSPWFPGLPREMSRSSFSGLSGCQATLGQITAVPSRLPDNTLRPSRERRRRDGLAMLP